MSTAFPIASEYFDLPITQLQESPTNPRRRFDERGLAELADSFKAQGVLQPLLVRALNNDTTADEDRNTQDEDKSETRYEVIAGARRLRAARLAALETVPVRVIQLSDAACAETQLVENIQREDVHPLGEAFAFHALLHTQGLHYDIQTLAAKAGKSAAFVATRLRLTELIPSIAEAFLADQIGVGHALEIAKLPQSEQQSAFDACFRAVWSGAKESRVLIPVRELAHGSSKTSCFHSIPCRSIRMTKRLCPRPEAVPTVQSALGTTLYFLAKRRRIVVPTAGATTTSWPSTLKSRLRKIPSLYRSRRHGEDEATVTCLGAVGTSR